MYCMTIQLLFAVRFLVHCDFCMIFIVSPILIAYVHLLQSGGGIYAEVAAPGFDHRPIANNGIIVSSTEGIRLECVSSQPRLGVIIGLDGSALPLNEYTGPWVLTNPHHRPGVLWFQNLHHSSITTAEQGVYTCLIPDSNGTAITINVGLYPYDYNGEW